MREVRCVVVDMCVVSYGSVIMWGDFGSAAL